MTPYIGWILLLENVLLHLCAMYFSDFSTIFRKEISYSEIDHAS